jgi:hypothetical protein
MRSRGQALTELAVLLPFMLLIFMGVWTGAALIADNNVAAQASRAGARYAAELGNDGYPATGNSNPLSADTAIIDQMLPIFNTQMTNATVSEIDIYEPNACSNGGTFSAGACPPDNGAYVSPEPIDEYRISGTTITATNAPQYTLDRRTQLHPDEAELGVRVTFTFTAPAMPLFNQTDTAYTVMRLAPEE